MHDHVYRMGVAWQNTAYNQPPHLGYYLPDYINGKLPTCIANVACDENRQTVYDLTGRRRVSLKRGLNIVVDEHGQAKKIYVQ
jgi:rhamnogalacturonan endolyase